VLAPVLLAQRGARGITLPRSALLRALLVGTAGITASNFFYYLAIAKTTVATAITLQYLAPIMVLCAMVALGRQRATLLRVGAVALAVAGSALAVGLGREEFKANAGGVAAALGSAAGFSFYNIGGSALLERYDRWLVFL